MTRSSAWQLSPIIFFPLLTCTVAQSKHVFCMNEPATNLASEYLMLTIPKHLHLCPHVNNMTLTDTAEKNCHRSSSDYSNEYLFGIATINPRIYTHKLNSNRAHLHQIKTSTKDESHSWLLHQIEHTFIKSKHRQRISHIPDSCNLLALQFAINLLICNSILLAIYLHTNCNQLALCILLPLAISLLRN